MKEYIEREAAVKEIKNREVADSKHYNAGLRHAARVISNALAADVRPVVHGKWVHGREVGREYLGDCLVGIFYDRWTCSECGYIVDDHEYSKINYNFCPNCGADMRK